MNEALLNDLLSEADNLERRLMSRDSSATRITADDIAPTLADLRTLRNEVAGWPGDDATVTKRFLERLAAIKAAQPAFREIPLVHDEPRTNWTFPTGHPFH